MSNTPQSNIQVNSPSPFAPSPDEAENRFKEYKSKDPFPDILPALLNSADIYDYVAVTGMIDPFDPDKLKSASYEVNLLGKCVYYDEQGKKQVEYIQKNKEFILKPNSIAFVTVEPMFRLPDYIALRFNLKITHVYRGLLLGTGPLVDPGFVGRLSIPLHNLTTNDYRFFGGEALIWVEFTKLSHSDDWRQLKRQRRANLISRQGKYIPFPARKNQDSDVEEYLLKADRNRPIRSSIPDAIQDARNSAEKAAQSAERAAQSAEKAAQEAKQLADEADKKLTQSQQRFTIGTLIGVSLSIIAVVMSSWQLVSFFLSTSEYLNETREKNINHADKINSLEREIQRLNKRIDELENSTRGRVQKRATPKVSSTATP
ncbi:hypothetical protein VF14_09150 [Nostoc linckia z18]|uniref:Deoxycytidine triphosphate deaminase n=2 Tax=Nostoc linckia TaxID=92942 RepID=A0A9Q6EMA5_NOSLI|nr:hypothetical protein [Nostoc linckia]PHK39148.1 hypothetical protein VF12_15365 [Nostoc linckia z15]PHK46997.1 hypothetical protein VF13_07635 [Nostoc linckia z16]PHJ61574.1 hypothetical protein VF02_19545 [Nostoc linckia z1]PHJ65855.1 hypothetical protein VF05_20390 [Nostoc linckia z3]PHJ72139.1 hypothetical protein VF03_19070 [Nostoc linckia z2]